MYLKRADLGVKKSKVQGYGVFAMQEIKSGDVVEECYTLIHKYMSELEDYVFEAKDGSNISALALGYGSIYNHSPTPNAHHILYPDQAMLRITAARDIQPGEEIFVSYGENWFAVRKLKPSQLSIRHRITRRIKQLGFIWRFVAVVGLGYAFLHMVNK